MNMTKCIEPLSALESRSNELLKTARESGCPVLLTEEGRPTAVLQDVGTYQRQQDTLAFLKLVVQGVQDERRGDVISHQDADAHFRKRLAAMRAGE